VKRAKGAAGIDGQSLSDFAGNLEREIDCLYHELKTKRYRAQPVKRVEIPKDDGGVRQLGIPTVRDRVVQQVLRTVLEPLYDKDFHPSSYGYRSGRSCQQAISKASLFIRRYDLRHVVDMDLSKCFDTLSHEIILDQFRHKVTDGSVLNLLRQFLESGVMVGMEYEPTERGSPQGGVISPLICNVYLDQFDQYMKSRGHRIVRYADDILILCRSSSAADNARQVASRYLEEDLQLTVNTSKTHIAHSEEGVKFLSVEIRIKYTRIQEKKLIAFKRKVKTLTRRNVGTNLQGVIRELNPVLRGFVNYFKIANCSRELKKLMGWIRRRLRCIQLKQWKKPGRLHRRLKQLGYKPPFKFIRMRSWRNARSPLASHAMPNCWFHEELGLVDLAGYETGVLVPLDGNR
jgi:group II intron reverse transcriptase/maturase